MFFLPTCKKVDNGPHGEDDTQENDERKETRREEIDPSPRKEEEPKPHQVKTRPANATTAVMVAQMRRVKRVEKTADNMKTFFTSSMGPMSMKVMSAPGGSKLVMLRATIASDDEH